MRPYLGAFINSYEFFKKSVEENYHSNFKVALADGIASIESYLREKAKF